MLCGIKAWGRAAGEATAAEEGRPIASGTARRSPRRYSIKA